MTPDTPTKAVHERLHAVLKRAHAVHQATAAIASTVYSGPVAPPAPMVGQSVGSAAPGGAA